MVQHETGNGLYAYPRGRPGRDSSQLGEKLPCPVDVDQKLSKLRLSEDSSSPARIAMLENIQFERIQIEYICHAKTFNLNVLRLNTFAT